MSVVDMTADKRATLVERFLDTHCMGVMSSKGKSYSRGESNVNSNFYRNAEGLGTEPMHPAWLFALKQIDSITDYVKNGCRGTHIAGESVESRLGDVVNYCLILYSILVQEGVLEDPTAPKDPYPEKEEWFDGEPKEAWRSAVEVPALPDRPLRTGRGG